MTTLTTPESAATELGTSSRSQRQFAWRPWMVVGLVAALLAAAVGLWKAVTAEESAPPTYGEYDTAVRSAIAGLVSSDGIQGTQRGHVGDRLSGAVWFDSRSNGDWVVVQRQDRSVTAYGWPLDPNESAAPEVVTTIWVQVGDVLYEAMMSPDQPEGSWTTLAPADGLTRAFGLSLLERGASLPATNSGVVGLAEPAGGGEIWTLTAPVSDGEGIARWEIGPDGVLVSWSFELMGVSPENLEFPGETSGEVRFAPLVDPDPIMVPDLAQPPDPAVWGLPADFPL